jgi:heat shock protein 1/8
VIQHPDFPDTPAYKVQVLQPSPYPLPVGSRFTSPAASHAPSPRSEPVLVDCILTVSEVKTIFLKSLIESAEDFLGKQVTGTVISVPSTFTDVQKDALEKAASDAGVKVLQLLDEVGAAAATTTTTTPEWSAENLHKDRTQLIIDLGSSSVSLNVLSVREGLAYSLASLHSSSVGANHIDDRLIKFFAADFAKTTKIPLTLCPSSSPVDQRAKVRLRLAIEHTKCMISASPGGYHLQRRIFEGWHGLHRQHQPHAI